MKQRSILRYLLPMVVMIVFAGLLLAEMTGISIEARGMSIALLEDPVPAAAAQTGPARILVAYNPSDTVELSFSTALTSTLNETRYAYQTFDVSADPLPDLAALRYLSVLQPVPGAAAGPPGRDLCLGRKRRPLRADDDPRDRQCVPGDLP